MIESGITFIGKVLREIEDKKLNDDQKAATESERKTKGSELYNAMEDVTIKYGKQQVVNVGTGTRAPGVVGYTAGIAPRWIAPLIEIETEKGNVNMQILEIDPYHVEDNLYRPLGFIILMNGNLLVSTKPSGEVINWLGEKASSDEIDSIRDNVLPLMEEAYAKLRKPKQIQDNSTRFNATNYFKGPAPHRIFGHEHDFHEID